VLEAPHAYAADCFRQYGLRTDETGRYAAMYKPFHLIGLELNIAILSAALRREPTGCTSDFRGDVVATAKRPLKAGDRLDGEGGFTVWGKLMPARDSLALGGLPIGLAHDVRLVRQVAAGQAICWRDIEVPDHASEVQQLRLAMERHFSAKWHIAAGRSAPRKDDG
jgi:predicted homoserine dehydrogenase-like protein